MSTALVARSCATARTPSPLEGYEDSALRKLWPASLLSQTVAGDSALQKVPRLAEPEGASAKREALELPRGALVASSNGLSLHDATRIEADDRAALARMIRYMARPPLAKDVQECPRCGSRRLMLAAAGILTIGGWSNHRAPPRTDPSPHRAPAGRICE